MAIQPAVRAENRPLRRFQVLRAAGLEETQASFSSLLTPFRVTPTGRTAGVEVLSDVSAVRLGPVSLIYGRNVGAELDVQLTEWVSYYDIHFALEGANCIETRDERVLLSARRAGIISPQMVAAMHLSDQYAQLHVRIERFALERHLERVLDRPVTSPVRFRMEMDLTDPAVASWARGIQLLLDDLDEPSGLTAAGAGITPRPSTHSCLPAGSGISCSTITIRTPKSTGTSSPRPGWASTRRWRKRGSFSSWTTPPWPTSTTCSTRRLASRSTARTRRCASRPPTTRCGTSPRTGSGTTSAGAAGTFHTTDIALKHIVDLLLSVRAQAYLVEASNVRHEADYQVWQDVKLPEGKILVPGVVGHATSNLVESPEVVADRLIRYAGIVGRENVIAGTDCGLGGRCHDDVAWAKLRSLAEGAALASRQLWG